MTPPFEEKQAICRLKIGPGHTPRCRFGGMCCEQNCPMYPWVAESYPPPINHEKERKGGKPMR